MKPVHVFEEVPFETLLSDSAFGPRFSSDCYAHDGSIATLRTTDLDSDGNLNYEGMPLASLEESKFKKHFLNKGDLVISRSGTVGIASVFKEFYKPVLPGAFLIRFTFKDGSDPQFYRYFFNSPSGRERVLSIATGAVQQNINITNMKALKVPSPPLSFQKAAVKKLKSFDNLIENNNRRIAILEEMAQSLYREWLVKFRFPGYEQCQMVESPLGLIPEGWKVQTLKETLELAYGKALKKADRNGGDIAVYGSGGVGGFHDTALVNGPCIIVGRKGNVGSVFWCDNDCWPIDTVFYVKSEHSKFFLYFNLLNQTFHNSDAAVPGLNRESAYSNKLILPVPMVLEQFDSVMRPIFSQLKNLRAKNANLKAQRDLLLPKLISGQIDLSQVEQASA
ncbi:restriction endonuclease subunit S [Amphritea sp.]|uniref:restriction endonuclease subunit S n=1 Tax=Amphritea sp. TaxID=1872502 RepID=UPI003D125C3A